MKIGFHSPLPPAHSGVADYSASLLAALKQFGSVEANATHADVHLYHLGNNALHGPIYRRAMEHPGVAVFHDAVLHHFYLGQLAEPAYLDEFVFNYGEWNRSFARDLYRARAASGSDERYFQYPMLKRAATRSLSVIVHNQAAARLVRDHAPAAEIHEIPHLFAPPPLPSEVDVLRYRERLGLDPATFVFAVFGYLRESKRLVAVLDAFAKLRRDNPHTVLLIAGEFVSTDLERSITPLLAAPGIRRLPFLSEAEFWLAASAIDACINLRYPSAGETSGIAIRLMGLGKPVLVSEGEEYVRIPEDACVRVAAGPSERDSLLHYMTALAGYDGLAREIGRRAADHITSCHGMANVAAKYWKVLAAKSNAVPSETRNE